jgi:integrase
MQKVVSQADNNKATNYRTHPVSYAFMFLQRELTKDQYANRLKLFFNFHQFPGDSLDKQGLYFLQRARQDPQQATMLIMQFLVHHRDRVDAGQITAGTLKQLRQSIRKFTDAFMELRTAIDWKRIIESMPQAENYADDRIPDIGEVRKLIEHTDRRVKPIVCTMCSCGMRVGSWESLKLKHITPITAAEHLRWKKQMELQENGKSDIVITADDETKIIAARIILHGEKKKKKRRNTDYLSFVTPESWFAIQKWVEFRKRYGEQITGESWVMRRLFPIAHKKPGEEVQEESHYRDISKHNGGSKVDVDAAHPIKLTRKAIFSLLSRAMYQQGIRTPLAEGKTRHPFKTDHFARKWFSTRAKQHMNALNVMKLMDQKVSVDPNFESYYKPIEQELLTDFLRAVPSLTISEDKDMVSIKHQQAVLEQKQQDKDRELQELKEKMTSLEYAINALKVLQKTNSDLTIGSDKHT